MSSANINASPAAASAPQIPQPGLGKTYTPAASEPSVRARWESSSAFRADPARVLSGQAKPYCILIPPPNVTGALHLGHALNNTLQDILTRSRRMMREPDGRPSFETLWMPGTDHAGIATQAVVEKRLLKEQGKRRKDFTREQFVELVQKWKDEYEARITEQLRAMGCSCDFSRQRFTMDDICARAVREAFFILFRDGLIYRGKRLVNWDPALQTAVADDECYEEEVDAAFYYLRYPLVSGGPALRAGSASGGPVLRTGSPSPITWGHLAKLNYPTAADHPPTQQAWITVATTRPETYLGDTAVAISQHDPRAPMLRGMSVQLPIVNRIIPIIEDTSGYVVLPKQYARSEEEAADPKAQFATGFLKVTPAHDNNDYQLGELYKDQIATNSSGQVLINILSPDGKLSDQHGWQDTGDAKRFLGLQVMQTHDNITTPSEARKAIVDVLKHHKTSDNGQPILESIRKYSQTLKFSDRSKAVIEPYLSDQWFMRVTDDSLAGSANRALVIEQCTDSGGPVLRTGSASGGPVLRTGSATGGPALRAGSLESHSNSHQPSSPSLHLINSEKLPLRHPATFVGRDPYPPGSASPKDMVESKRTLPHMRLDNATYFVTWRVMNSGRKLDRAERDQVMNALKYFDGERIELFAASVMPDHVHVMVRLLPGHDLLDWTASVKRFSARAINKQQGDVGSLWQDESFDCILRDAGDFAETLLYIAQNPVKEGLVTQPSDYDALYVSAPTLNALTPKGGPTPGGPVLRTGSPPSGGPALGGPALRAGSLLPSQNQPAGSENRPTSSHTSSHNSSSSSSPTDHQLRFHPARYAKTYEQWHDNIRDWCISRQLWWGHRIPVWSAKGLHFYLGSSEVAEQFAQLEVQLQEWELQGRIAIHMIGDDPNDDAFVCVRDPEGQDRDIVRILESHVFDGAISRETHEGFERDPDVLDTWFSSALWPLSTLGWPDPAQSPQTKDLLEAFNPTSVLSTAREIITLWVSRMVMMNRYLLSDEVTKRRSDEVTPNPVTPSLRHSVTSPGSGHVPFHNVFIHAVVQDGDGKRMSKSAGNGVDPLDIIDSHGADAMRFTLCQMTTSTQDVRMPVKLLCPHCKHVFAAESKLALTPHEKGLIDQKCPKCARPMCTSFGVNNNFIQPTDDKPEAANTSEKFDLGRNLCNKLWNASRFTLSIFERISAAQAASSSCSTSPSLRHSVTPSLLLDRWLLSRLATATRDASRALDNFEFSDYAETIYKLLWWDFCDWYLEAIKPTVDKSPEQQAVLAHALETILRLLHPIAPFITESIYEHVRTLHTAPIPGFTLAPPLKDHLLCTAGWPQISESLIDPAAESQFEELRELINQIRNVRSEHQVLPKRKITLHAPQAIITKLAACPGMVETLAGLDTVAIFPPASGKGVPPVLPSGAVPFRALGFELALSNLADAKTGVDAAAEIDRLKKQLETLTKSETALAGRLNNPGYVDKAPAKLVEESKAQLAKIRAELEATAARIKDLGGS